jgi:hypothetical protein
LPSLQDGRIASAGTRRKHVIVQNGNQWLNSSKFTFGFSDGTRIGSRVWIKAFA